jgi:quinoprotein glucose dehydrogenase
MKSVGQMNSVGRMRPPTGTVVGTAGLNQTTATRGTAPETDPRPPTSEEAGTMIRPAVVRTFIAGMTAFLTDLPCLAAGWQDPAVALWEAPPPEAPQLAAASDDGQRAVSSFKIPPGWKIELFAAEPLVANGVALHVDYDGTVLVCETFRQEQGVEDNRGHGHWLLDDLAAQTVEDRQAYILKHLGEKALAYTRQDDRIRVLRDNDGDGLADESHVFASGFNTILSGTGAGVLRYRGQTYFTCIPDLWRLTSAGDADVATERQVLHRGYGVRFAFRGHDLHGLIIGPDGRLYYSIGDRGYNLQTESGHWKDPASGAVFRCNLDGSDLQVIATGLRNPQGLAFDDYGNLFTGDNNSDSGDQAKWFYIVPGGDYGWRMNYQYLPDRGPYNRERLWNPYEAGRTPAYVIPPIANISDGPSGLVHYPGTGLAADWLGSFFLCDFRGQSSGSGLRRLKNRPQGAFFQLDLADEPIWQILATDAKFSPSGELYILDWVEGWVGEGKGRIYRAYDPQHQTTPVVQQTRQLLNGELWQADAAALQLWLAHPDQRVRQESQFELARRGELERLLATAKRGSAADSERLHQLSRLHGIWGSCQWYRQTAAAERGAAGDDFFQHLLEWFRDEDAAIRALAAEQASDLSQLPDGHPWRQALSEMVSEMVSDGDNRVSYFAMLVVGQQRLTDAADAVLARLNANADADPILRHGAIMALAGIDDPGVWEMAIGHSSPAVRLATTVALRRVRSPLLTRGLRDGQIQVAAEAARAIYDLPLESGWRDLAAYLPYSAADDSLARRAINANFRLGGREQAEQLAAFAASTSGSVERRIEALQRLAEWDQTVPLDPVLNDYRPRTAGDRQVAVTALRSALPQLLAGDPAIASPATEVAAVLGITEVAPILESYFVDRTRSGGERAAALRSWFRLVGSDLKDLLLAAANSDPAVEVRAAAIEILPDVDQSEAGRLMAQVLEQGQIAELKAAFGVVHRLPPSQAWELLQTAVDRVAADALPVAVQLELLEALAPPATIDLLAKFHELRKTDPSGGVATKFPELLQGGDWERGRQVFFEKTEVSCVRCHAVNGVGGGVGPDLSALGGKKDRAYLLESIIDPNAVIAEGFETQLILDLEGVTHFGIVKAETDHHVELMDADGQLKRVLVDDIEQRRRGQSSMPAGLNEKLTPRELRDLVEYLAALRSEP